MTVRGGLIAEKVRNGEKSPRLIASVGSPKDGGLATLKFPSRLFRGRR